MTEQVASSTLCDNLARLETRLGTPVIPGEEAAWLKSVADALADLERELRPAISTAHRTQFAAMRVEDAVLSPQIESLKSADEGNLQRLDELNRRLAKLQGKFKTEANESLLTEDFESFVDEGLGFVMGVRKQETAIQTWFSEALRRDVGPSD